MVVLTSGNMEIAKTLLQMFSGVDLFIENSDLVVRNIQGSELHQEILVWLTELWSGTRDLSSRLSALVMYKPYNLHVAIWWILGKCFRPQGKANVFNLTFLWLSHVSSEIRWKSQPQSNELCTLCQRIK